MGSVAKDYSSYSSSSESNEEEESTDENDDSESSYISNIQPQSVSSNTNQAPKLTDFKTMLNSPAKFSTDFLLRVYTSGCYYYDTSSDKWSSAGLEIQQDSSLTQTHCVSSHLTSFAGGLVVVPSQINFEYVWANASFTQNPIIYSTIIVVSCLYVLFAVWARVMDKRDSKKMSILPLKDNLMTNEYYYEVIVFTGSRPEAGTDSKVRMIVNGNNMETEIRLLNHTDKQVFRRSGIDSFLMAVQKWAFNFYLIEVKLDYYFSL